MPSISPTVWERTKRGSRASIDKIWAVADRINHTTRTPSKIGSEAFWPTTLDREAAKTSQVLRSFSRDGFLYDDYGEVLDDAQRDDSSTHTGNTSSSGRQPQRVLMKIPPEVIQQARGLAIFTMMRAGFWLSGPGGSGVLVARLPDGNWSSPSAIMVHAAGLYFPANIDVYDCVLILNTQSAVDAFAKMHFTIGDELDTLLGRLNGADDKSEYSQHNQPPPMYTYLRSKGFYADVNIDGAVIEQRADENDRFYQNTLPAKDILAGLAPATTGQDAYALEALAAMIKVSEGGQLSPDKVRLLPTEPTPSDFDVFAGPIESRSVGHSRKSSLSSLKVRLVDHSTGTSEIPSTPSSATSQVFGVPAPQDPDPFGVRALEQQGLAIREAGSHRRANSDQFDFKPLPSSPIYPTFNRLSVDSRSSVSSFGRRTSWRTNVFGMGGGRDRSGSGSTSEASAQPGGAAHRNSTASAMTPMTPIPRSEMTDMSTQKETGEESPALSQSALFLQPPLLPPRQPTTINEVPEMEHTPRDEKEAYDMPLNSSGRGLTINVPSISTRTAAAGEDLETPKMNDYADNGVSPMTSPVDSTGPSLHTMPTFELEDEQNKPVSPVASDAIETGLEDRHLSNGAHEPDERVSLDRFTSTTAPATEPAISPDPSSQYPSRPSSSAATSPPLSNNAFTSANLSHPNTPLTEKIQDDDGDDEEDEDDDNFMDFDDIETVEIVAATPVQASATKVTPITPFASASLASPTIIRAGDSAVTPVTITKPKMVNVPKRVAPALPARNPHRALLAERERKGSAASSSIYTMDDPPTPVSGSESPRPRASTSTDEATTSSNTTAVSTDDPLPTEIKSTDMEFLPTAANQPFHAPPTPIRSPRRLDRPTFQQRSSTGNLSDRSGRSGDNEDGGADESAEYSDRFTEATLEPSMTAIYGGGAGADQEEMEIRGRSRQRSVSRGRVGKMSAGRVPTPRMDFARMHGADERSASPAVAVA